MSDDVTSDLAAAALSLARRFSAGGTLWCVSPAWPAHGRHVAVEFVHPVIVGKRALPAVHVDDVDLVGAVRLLARPGDVVLAVAPADDQAVGELARRADAWGIASIWVGAGPRPPAGAADHVVWLDDRDPLEAGRDGSFVLLYHLLWELTHVVFEHPGLLEPTAEVCTDDVCVTCSDEGRLAEVIDPGDGVTAVVVAAGRRESIDVSLVGPLTTGTLVVVHAGSAITVLEEAGRG